MIETIDGIGTTGNFWTPAVQPANRDWGFLLKWIGISILVGLFFILAIYINGYAYSAINIPGSNEEAIKSMLYITVNLTLAVTLGAIIGAATGLWQWLALKRRVHRWMLASTLGAVLVMSVDWLISYVKYIMLVNSLGIKWQNQAQNAAEYDLHLAIRNAIELLNLNLSPYTLGYITDLITGPLFLGLLLGAGLGAVQALVLRRHVCRAGWWVLANILGWGFGLTTFVILDKLTSEPLRVHIDQLFVWIIASAVVEFDWFWAGVWTDHGRRHDLAVAPAVSDRRNRFRRRLQLTSGCCGAYPEEIIQSKYYSQAALQWVST